MRPPTPVNARHSETHRGQRGICSATVSYSARGGRHLSQAPPRRFAQGGPRPSAEAAVTRAAPTPSGLQDPRRTHAAQDRDVEEIQTQMKIYFFSVNHCTFKRISFMIIHICDLLIFFGGGYKARKSHSVRQKSIMLKKQISKTIY